MSDAQRKRLRVLDILSLAGVSALPCLFFAPACTEDLRLGPDPGASVGGASGSGTLGEGGERWTGNPPECPADGANPPRSEEPCDAPEGMVCAFIGPVSELTGNSTYTECACVPAAGGQRLWWCYRNHNHRLCPAGEPTPGTSCADRSGASCDYPDWKRCSCPVEPAEPVWICGNAEWPGYAPPELPASLDETSKVTELDGAGRIAFCEWLVDSFSDEGSADPPAEWPLDADGYSTEAFFEGGSFPCNVCAVPLPIDYCVGNLELSTCEATVAELSDCVRTMARQCLPSPLGCVKYVEQAGCLGTIVGEAGMPPDSLYPECRLRVQ